MEKKFEKGDIVDLNGKRLNECIICKIIYVFYNINRATVEILENYSSRKKFETGRRLFVNVDDLKNSEKEPKVMIKEKEKFKEGDIVKWTVGEIAKWTKERVSGFLIGKIVSFYPNTYVDIVVLENHNEDPEYLPIGTITAVRLFNLEHYSEKSPKETCKDFVQSMGEEFKVGDRVESSQYDYGLGRVVGTSSSDEMLKVKWDNGLLCSYYANSIKH